MRIEQIDLKAAMKDILTMTSISKSGHPGGSLSSLELLFSAYISAGWGETDEAPREKVIVSNGHIAPGVYTVLGHLGIIPLEEAIAYFRLAGSPYEGHIESHIPGIPWSTGNLGQGLSAACGFALDEKLHDTGKSVFCIMGDAEQAKGQTSEARKFAVHHKLNNIIALIDRNHIQISGMTEDVMNVNIPANYLADGWKVIEVNGHNMPEINDAVSVAKNDLNAPYCIVAETVMGHGIPFMEGTPEYHGKSLDHNEYIKACEHLNTQSDCNRYREMRENPKWTEFPIKGHGQRKDFVPPEKAFWTDKMDLRGSWGKYLDAAEKNSNIVVFDCDLGSSVKTGIFAKSNPGKFIQSGVMEHNVATLAGALSIDPDLNVFWADFGMFNVAEVYNQLRLNDINHANLNIISTHIGIDVGEDGKTHQSIDYISLFRNLFGFKVYLPGDFNQLQHILEEVFRDYGNKFVGMGRSKLDAVKKRNGEIFYDKDYVWERGKIDEIRAGEDIWIISTGQVAVEAQKAADILRSKNIGAGHYHMATPLETNPDFFRERNIPQLAVTVEDHNSNTGLGAIVVENLGKHTSVEKLGVSHYYYSGKASSLYAKAGIDAKGIVEKISQLLSI